MYELLSPLGNSSQISDNVVDRKKCLLIIHVLVSWTWCWETCCFDVFKSLKYAILYKVLLSIFYANELLSFIGIIYSYYLMFIFFMSLTYTQFIWATLLVFGEKLILLPWLVYFFVCVQIKAACSIIWLVLLFKHTQKETWSKKIARDFAKKVNLDIRWQQAYHAS